MAKLTTHFLAFVATSIVGIVQKDRYRLPVVVDHDDREIA
jgi:hypothetical protein